MLDLNPDTVCQIIAHAREFHAKDEVNIPESPSRVPDDTAFEVLEEHADDLIFQELKVNIDDLEPDQQVTLVALMWLGRGDFAATEWETALADAEASWTPRAAEYLIATPLVADYLTEGLSQLGYSCEG